LAAENPHGHAQYLIYQICVFLKIPIYKFNNWNLAPLLFLQNELTKDIIIKSRKSTSSFDQKIDNDITQYIDIISKSPEDFEFRYMKNQKNSRKFFNRIYNFFRNDIVSHLKDIKHNSYMSFKRIYNPINPYKLNFLTRLNIRSKRKKNLRNAIFKFSEYYDINKDYVYFPLHFEPERTTNPDGGFFQDQLLAILKLRSFLPDKILIYVKEHPSQQYNSDRGSRGRSPLFYRVLQNIYNVKFLSPNENSYRLIQNSLFTCSITGSVALESSIMGKKSIIFGSAWFDDCPNIFNWSEKLDFDKFISFRINDTESIKRFLISKRNTYTVPAFQNGSAMRYFNSYNDQEFYKNQVDEITSLIEDLIKTKFS
jgi:hypothetical protein